MRVISGSPAEEAGVRSGDRIYAVNGRSTASLSTDQAANLLQGPEGSRVQLTLAGAGQPARQTVVERRVVEVPSVNRVKIVDPQYGVGYIPADLLPENHRPRPRRRLVEAARQGDEKPGDRTSAATRAACWFRPWK